MKYDTQRPYAASYVIVKNDAGMIAFVLRSNTSWMDGYYGLPAGKTEVDESFSEGAIREAKEEIGIIVESEDLKHSITIHRYSKKGGAEKDTEDMQWVDVYFEVTKWQGEVHNAEPDVHSEIAWLDPFNLPDNVIPAVSEALKAINEGKKYLEYGYDK